MTSSGQEMEPLASGLAAELASYIAFASDMIIRSGGHGQISISIEPINVRKGQYRATCASSPTALIRFATEKTAQVLPEIERSDLKLD